LIGHAGLPGAGGRSLFARIRISASRRLEGVSIDWTCRRLAVRQGRLQGDWMRFEPPLDTRPELELHKGRFATPIVGSRRTSARTWSRHRIRKRIRRLHEQEVPMPRVRLRLATLGLLIVVIAMAIALVMQQRREKALHVRMKALEAQNTSLIVERARDRGFFDRKLLERREISRQREMNKLRAEIDRLSDKLVEAGRHRPTGRGDVKAPQD
jgi:hypothetical protein